MGLRITSSLSRPHAPNAPLSKAPSPKSILVQLREQQLLTQVLACCRSLLTSEKAVGRWLVMMLPAKAIMRQGMPAVTAYTATPTMPAKEP